MEDVEGSSLSETDEDDYEQSRQEEHKRPKHMISSQSAPRYTLLALLHLVVAKFLDERLY